MAAGLQSDMKPFKAGERYYQLDLTGGLQEGLSNTTQATLSYQFAIDLLIFCPTN